MPSELYTADGFDGTDAGPVGAAVRRRLGALLAVFCLVAAAVAAAATTLDLTAVVPPSVPVSVSAPAASHSLSDLRLAAEVGALSGAFAAGIALVGVLRGDARVALSRGRRHAAVGTLAFAAGSAAGVALLPATVAATVSVTAVPTGLDVYRAAELWLFFPVAVGAAAAAPFLLVAAVRAGVVGRFTSARQRGYVALAVAVFAACFSPPDSATFVLFSAPPLVGFALGVGWLEFG